MRLYSGFIIAFKLNDGIARPATILANSKDEAIGKLYELMHETFPTSEGYFGHKCDAIEVPKVVYYAAYDGYVLQ